MIRFSSAAVLAGQLMSASAPVAAQQAGAPSPVAAPSQQDIERARIPVERLERLIVSRNAAMRSEPVDHERLTARRIDIVDETGTIRMTIAAPNPNPIIDGVEYRRAHPVTGILFFNRDGRENGGIGVGDDNGEGIPTVAMDYSNSDAIGWRVEPDRSVTFIMNQAPPVVREPALENRLVPALVPSTRIRFNVAANGQPTIALADGQNRPRLRLIVTSEGYGAIEFLNAQGNVVHILAPERDIASPDR